MRKILVLMLSMLMLASFNVSSVSAHTASAACSGPIKIIVYEHDFSGAWDDFCWDMSIHSDWTADFYFSRNEPYGTTDIGDRYNMDNRVSSVAMVNTGTLTACVTFFHDPYMNGTPFVEKLAPGEHDHMYPNWFDNDSWSSLRVKRTTNCLNNH